MKATMVDMPTDDKRPKPGSAAEIVTLRERELLERIRHLEEMNSALQDKLDMIWSILEPDYELPGDSDGGDHDEGEGLVQIEGLK